MVTGRRRMTITTETKRKKKPHKKFEAVLRFDSTPTELTVKANSTKTEIRDLTPNPYKYSFGEVTFPHGRFEACIYINRNNPQKMPNSVLWYFKKDHFAKGEGLVCDKRRALEFYSLQSKIRYFLSLSPKRKLEYLRNKGFFANIDNRKDTYD